MKNFFCLLIKNSKRNMALWCPISLRILLSVLIPNHDTIDIILNIAKKDYEKETREHHEGITANYKVNGYKGWLTSLKEKHYDCQNYMLCLNSFPSISTQRDSLKWPDYNSLGFSRRRYVHGYDYDYDLHPIYININRHIHHYDYENIIIENMNNTWTLNVPVLQNLNDIGDKRNDIVRHIPKITSHGVGGKMIHMKKNSSTWGVKSDFSHKRRIKHTNKEKRSKRIDQKDMKFMKRRQMKKCYVR